MRLLLALALATACAPPVPDPGGGDGTSGEERDGRRRAGPPVVEPLYADEWPGFYVELLGVDAERERTALLMVSSELRRAVIDVVDYRRGTRLERLEAAADYPSGHPRPGDVSGSAAQDIARFSTIAFELAAGRSGLGVTVSPDGQHALVAMQGSGDTVDALFVADRNGAVLRQLAPGLTASYEPAFSPDGARVAFRGCLAEPSGRCPYYLQLATLDGPPVRIEAAPEPSNVVFLPEGTALVTAALRGVEACLVKVELSEPYRASDLGCFAAPGETHHLAADAAGETAVLATAQSEAGTDFDYVWVRLADGHVLGRHHVDRTAFPPVLLDGPRLVTEVRTLAEGSTLHVIDLPGGRARAIGLDELGGAVTDLRRGEADGEEVVLAVRRPDRRRVEIVRLHIDRGARASR
jgi:hypothetical protein